MRPETFIPNPLTQLGEGMIPSMLLVLGANMSGERLTQARGEGGDRGTDREREET